MQRFTLVHPSEFSRSNSPTEIFPSESPSCESLPSPLIFYYLFFPQSRYKNFQFFINLIVDLMIANLKIRMSGHK